MSYADTLKGLIINSANTNSSGNNQAPGNIRKRRNIALGLEHFPDLPNKKSPDKSTTNTATTNISSAGTSISTITEERINTLDGKIHQELKSTKIDLTEQIANMSRDLKSELETMVAETTSNALNAFKQEMNKHYNNHMVKMFNEHMTAFRQELAHQFESMKEQFSHQMVSPTGTTGLHTQMTPLQKGAEHSMEIEASAEHQ
jgi:hypothetical protein